jgi:predicted nucleic-acid-binding protein
MIILIFEKADAVQEFIDTGRKLKLDLSDILIGTAAKNSGCETLLTFDLKAAKSDLFELLK